MGLVVALTLVVGSTIPFAFQALAVNNRQGAPDASPPPATPRPPVSGPGGAPQVRLRPPPDGLPLPAGCDLDRVVAIATGFLDAFSRGDRAALAAIIPDEAGGDAFPGEGRFGWLSVYGPTGGLAKSQAEVIAYARARHGKHERIRLRQIEASGSWWDSGVDVVFDLTREADDLPAQATGGKGTLDCVEGTIVVWSIGEREVVPDDWFGAGTPIPSAALAAAPTPQRALASFKGPSPPWLRPHLTGSVGDRSAASLPSAERAA